MQELIYTSSQSGLKPGVSGYCSVAWTRGISVPLIEPLENLSGYKPLYAPDDPRCRENPVLYACQKVCYGSLKFTAVSRIADAGLDYSKRSNKIAHHIVPEKADHCEENFYGAAGLLKMPENFCTKWSGEPRLLPEREPELPPPPQSFVARTWAKYKGDAGFAGYAAQRTAQLLQLPPEDPGASLFLSYPAGMPAGDILQMIFEILQLLPQALRCQCTFSTYFIQQQLGVECLLRAAPEGSPLISAMEKLAPGRVIRLAGNAPLPSDADPVWTEYARTGIHPTSPEQSLPQPEIRREKEPEETGQLSPEPALQDTAPGVPPSAPEKRPPAPAKARPFSFLPLVLVLGTALAAAVLIWLMAFRDTGRKNAKPPVNRPAETQASIPQETPIAPAPEPMQNGTSEEGASFIPIPSPAVQPHPEQNIPPAHAAAPEPDAPAEQEEPTASAAPAAPPVSAPAAPVSLTLRISENFVPELSGAREKTPRECAILKQYTTELLALHAAIEKWNQCRKNWFEADSAKKKAEKDWKEALKKHNVREKDLLPYDDFKVQLEDKLEKYRSEKDREEKALLKQDWEEWIAVRFPLTAIGEEDWGKSFADLEETLPRSDAPKKKRPQRKNPPHPQWLQQVYDDAKAKHEALYPAFREKQACEKREVAAWNAANQAGKELLASPLTQSCRLEKYFKKNIKQQKPKPINLEAVRKIVLERLSEKLAQEYRTES